MAVRDEYLIDGKAIAVYTPVGNKAYSAKDISDFLRRFQLHDALRLIGSLSHKWLSAHNQAVRECRGVPVSDSVLAYLAMRLIESSNDYRSAHLTESDVLQAVDMYWGLPEPIEAEVEPNPDSCLIRSGNTQFDYQRPFQNLLPRVLAIYRDLWPQVYGAAPIGNSIKSISGLSIEEILLMTFAFSGRAANGFFRLYPESVTTDERIRSTFTQEKQRSYVNWISCGYKEFRERSRVGRRAMPSSTYERNRFNPLMKYPAIRPDRNPMPGQPPVYIVPVPRLLIERVTRGLYFELSDHFRGEGRRNEFRRSFGRVFQEYVGVLLKDAVGPECVLPEFQYGKQNSLSPDWILVHDEQAVLIEVKQSGLFLEAKAWGDVERIKKDPARTAGSAIVQLWNFEQALRSGRFKEIRFLSHVREIERVVVTHDQTYFSNSILTSRILDNFRESGVGIPENYHCHIMSAEDLEAVLGIRNLRIFDLLKGKRLDLTDGRMDFQDYLARKHADRIAPNAYLNRITEAFFSKFNENLA